MNFAKLFVIFGIILIATLGEAEGRRRWFKRKYKTIGCASQNHIRFMSGSDFENNRDVNNSDLVVSHNNTGRNHRRSNKWRNCGENKCAYIPSTTAITDNSTDIQANNTQSTKVPRRLRNYRRGCAGRRRWRSKHNKTETDNRSNSTSTNGYETNRQRNKDRKCTGRRARKGKCQTPLPPHDNGTNYEEWIDTDGSVENEIHTDGITSPLELEVNIQ